MLKKFLLYFLFGFILSLCIGCKKEHQTTTLLDVNNDNNINNIFNIPIVYSGNGYDVAEFCSYDFDSDEYVPLLGVKYFVRNDTLFTDQIYRSISIFYQDDDRNITKCSSIARDFKNNPSVNGWYYLILDKEKLNDYPSGSKPCKIELCVYDGPVSTEGLSTTHAVLWNNSLKCRPNYIYDSIPGETSKILKMINTGKSQNI